MTETVFTQDMTHTDTLNEVAHRLAAADTATLMESLIVLDGSLNVTPEGRLTRAWLTNEVERRHPEVTPLMNAWSEDDATELSYVEALLVALPAGTI